MISVIVPSPNVTNNHQFINASTLNNTLSAIMLTEDRLYALTDVVRELIIDTQKRGELEKNIGQYAIRNANKIIFNNIQELI